MKRRILLAASVANPVVAVESLLDEVGMRYVADKGVDALHERLKRNFMAMHCQSCSGFSPAIEIARSFLTWIVSSALQQYMAPWETNLVSVAELMRQISLFRTVRHTEKFLLGFLSPGDQAVAYSEIELAEKKISSVIASAIEYKFGKTERSREENLLLLQSVKLSALTDSLFSDTYLHLESIIFNKLASGEWSANEVQSAFKKISGSQLCLLLRSTKEIVKAVERRLFSRVREQMPLLSEHFDMRSLRIVRPLWLLFILLNFLPAKSDRKELYSWFKRYTKKSDFARSHLRHFLPLLDAILFNKKRRRSVFRRGKKFSLGTPTEFLTFIAAITKRVVDRVKSGVLENFV